jgi:perosamine synthetase
MIPHSKPFIDETDHQAVRDALASGMIAQGNRVRQFEEAVTAYLGRTGGVAVNSGTAALILSLKALDVHAGDEVVLPTYVCRSVAEAVWAVGATPVICDIGDQWLMSPETVAAKVSSRTAALVAVHMFGIRADVAGLRQFGLPVIEDACQAFEARHEPAQGARDKAGGSILVLSFHAIKCLTTGEGGMALSDDPDVLEKMRRFRDGVEAATVARIGSPMTDLQAALGLSQLGKYDGFLRRRRAIADRYFDALADLPVQLPYGIRDKSIFFRFPVRIRGDFDTCREQLAACGVQVRRGVDALLHRTLAAGDGEFAGAERLFRETLSIPLYPALTDHEIETVVGACRTLLRKSEA